MNTINDVKKIHYNNRNFYYLRNNKIYQGDKCVIELSKNFFGDFSIFENKIIVQYYSGIFSIYCDETIEVDNIYGYYNYLNTKTITFLNTKDDFVYEYSNRGIKKLQFRQNGYFVNGIYIEISNDIKTYDYLSGNVFWRFDLSQLGTWSLDYETEKRAIEIKQFIGAYNGVLWVYLNSSEIIGIDIENSKLCYRISAIEEKNLKGETNFLSKENGYRLYDCKYILEESRGKIIGLFGDLFYEIDVNETPKVIAYGLKNEFEKKGVIWKDIAINSVLQGNQLYFYNYNQLVFAVLDIETKQITYVSEKIKVSESTDAFTQLKDLQVSEDKVYVLDSAGTLWIFEKEEFK